MPPAATGSLSFRAFTREDATDMAAVLCDPAVMEYSDHGALPADRLPAWIEKQNRPETHGGALFGRWAVVETASGTVIGYATLSRHAGRAGDGEAEIGYRLAKPCWGKGYGTEVAKALIAHGLSLPGVTRLIAIVDPHNRASVRVLEKAGMSVTGEIMFAHYDYPDLVYAIGR